MFFLERSLDELMRRYKDEIMRYAGRQSTVRPANAQMQNNNPNLNGIPRQQNNRNNFSTPETQWQNNMNNYNLPQGSTPIRTPIPQNNITNRQQINNVARPLNPISQQQNNMAMNRPMQPINSSAPMMPMQTQNTNNNSNLTVLPALNGNSDTGYMIVQVSALQGAVPIANADVVVTREIGNETYLMWYDVTDESGKSRKFELPAPPREMSEQPSNGSAPYSSYNVRVSAPGFYTVTNAGAQVFGGQTSIAAIDMIPKRESQMGTEENITYNTPPSQLLNS